MQLTETEKRFINAFELTETQWHGLSRFSIQEMVDKTGDQRKTIEANMDATKGGYDFDQANLMMGLGVEDRSRMAKSIVNTPLSRLLRAAYPELGLKAKEIFAESGTTGIQGAIYLIPDKIHQILFESAVETDRVEQISINVIPAEQIPGSTYKVDIEVDGSYQPYKYSSGGKLPDVEITVVQATLDFTQPWGLNFRITNDMIEDSQFDMIQFHLTQAGREFGEYATNEALTVLKTGTDGDGTVNSDLSGNADETKFTGATTYDLKDIHQLVLDDGYFPSHLILVPHAWYHSIVSTGFTAGASEYSEPWAYEAMVNGLPSKILGCEVIYSNVDTLTNSQAMTNLVTIMFDKRYALLSGRKRWLRIENYSDPVRDLVGAAVTARQDSVTVYNDSIGVITET